jgi:putative transposase
MTYNPAVDHRRSIRLQNFDYSQSGAYFVTIVSHQRRCILGSIENDCVTLSLAGQCVNAIISALPQHFPIEVNHIVVMPNHIHLLVTINSGVPENSIDDAESPRGTLPRSISALVQNLKANSTRHIRRILNNDEPVWQRNYFEHVVRDQNDFDRIYTYIENNPLTWQKDEFWK